MGSREDTLAQLYEEIGGPLDWLDSETAIGRLPGGMLVRFEPSHRQRLGLRGASVALDLGGRHITIEIDNRARTSLALPEVRTGDVAFDDLFVVYGWPEQTIRAALTDERRAWLTRRWPHGWSSVEASKGELRATYSLFEIAGNRAEIEPTELPAEVEQLSTLGSDLIAAYDRERADAARYEGPQGAADWEAGLAELEHGRARRRAGIRAIAIVVVVLLMIGIVAAVAFGSGAVPI